MEFTFSGNLLSLVDTRIVGDNVRFEHANDIVVTDNWVAIVTTYPDQNEIIIHRCSKGNVAGTFNNNFYSYPMFYLDGINHCCHMKGDTIASVTLYCSPTTVYYESRLRVFDLNSMTMTTGQWFPLLEKTEPLEVTYLPNYATLVTLQYQMYPSYTQHYTFVSWKPYSTTPYNAKLMYEVGDRIMYWIDKLTHKHVIATGGTYWMMKDMTYDDPTTTCYITAQRQVNTLQPLASQINNYPYRRFSIDIPKKTSRQAQPFENGGNMCHPVIVDKLNM